MGSDAPRIRERRKLFLRALLSRTEGGVLGAAQKSAQEKLFFVRGCAGHPTPFGLYGKLYTVHPLPYHLYLPPTTYHLLPTTYYLPPTTYYLP